MPMDGFTLSFMQRELRNTLLGGRVDKVNQPERDALVLLIRSGGNHKLLLSANANQARVQITSQTYENPAEPPMFCMLMRKHLMGSRIVEIEQISGDRILAITFDCLDEMGYHVRRTLYLEIMGRHSNLTLVDEPCAHRAARRHLSAAASAGQAYAGRTFFRSAQGTPCPAQLHAEQGADGMRGGYGQRLLQRSLRADRRCALHAHSRAGSEYCCAEAVRFLCQLRSEPCYPL